MHINARRWASSIFLLRLGQFHARPCTANHHQGAIGNFPCPRGPAALGANDAVLAILAPFEAPRIGYRSGCNRPRCSHVQAWRCGPLERPCPQASAGKPASVCITAPSATFAVLAVRIRSNIATQYGAKPDVWRPASRRHLAITAAVSASRRHRPFSNTESFPRLYFMWLSCCDLHR